MEWVKKENNIIDIVNYTLEMSVNVSHVCL